MIVMGIDPGSMRIGFGLIEKTKKNFSCLAYGTIDNPGISRGDDLINTAKELKELIERFKPELVVVERLFFSKNQKTAMAVSETRGVILLTCAEKNLPVQEVTPLQVKQAVVSYGKADKKQVQAMVQMIFGLKEPVKPDDAADALALALCYASTGSL